MITTEYKHKIMAAITANRANYPSDAKHAAALGMTTSVYSAVKKGEYRQTAWCEPTRRS